MTIKVDYISGARPWRKSFIKRDGEIEVSLSRPPYYLTSYRETYKDLSALHAGNIAHSKEGHALMRGLLKHTLTDEPRAGKIDKRAKTRILVLDIDGTSLTNDPVDYVQNFLGIPSVDMSIMFTSSQGMKPGLRANVIIELAIDESFTRIANVLWYLQLRNPSVADEIHLDASGSVLLPTVDIASAVPSQIFTIAPPKFVPASENPFDDDEKRFVFYKGESRTLTLGSIYPDDVGEVDLLKDRLLTQRRVEMGLSKVKPHLSTRDDSATGSQWTLVTDPEPAIMTGEHDCGDYVRIDINGGDSQAYWHMKGDSTYLYSFKGYIKYPLNKILPEYYASLISRERDRMKSRAVEAVKTVDRGEEIPLVVLDANSEQYHCCLVNKASTWEDVRTFTRMSSVKSWMETNGIQKSFENLPPVYDVVFDAKKPFFDPVNRTLNRFSAPVCSVYDYGYGTTDNLPPIIRRLISHVLNYDEVMVETFLDWVAFLYQRREAPHSAWLLHGCQGTGKDLTFNLLRRVLGERYCKAMMPHALNDGFNGWVEETSLVYVNEIDSRVFKGTNLTSRLNDYITAETLVVRRMRTDGYQVRNYAGYIFSSNRMDAVELPPNDRRFHVPPRQEEKLIFRMSDREIREIVNMSEGDMIALRGWFASRSYDEERLRRPVFTEAKRVLADASQPSATRLVNNLKLGNWEEIVDNLEDYITLFSGRGRGDVAMDISKFLTDLVELSNFNRSATIVITRNELRALFAAICDLKIADMAPGKFKQFLIHNEMIAIDSPVCSKRNGHNVRGVRLPLPSVNCSVIIRNIKDKGYYNGEDAPTVKVCK